MLKWPEIKVFTIQQTSKRGDPDLLICYKGNFLALELKKSSRDKARPLQEHILKQVSQAGGFARVVSPENLDEILAEIKELYD